MFKGHSYLHGFESTMFRVIIQGHLRDVCSLKIYIVGLLQESGIDICIILQLSCRLNGRNFFLDRT